MRFKRRQVLFVCIGSLIFYVSYKILEPEIWGTSLTAGEEEEIQRLKMRHQIEDKNNFRGHSHVKSSSDKLTKDQIVAELVKSYSLDFDKPLRESPWVIARNWVTLRNVHPSDTPELGAILRSMATRKITQADVGYKGTQLKMTVVLEGGQKAVFKPKWYARGDVIQGEIYAGADRHNGEIAVFHLGRLLELRKTPLVVGRVVDMATEIAPVASQRLKDTFYRRGNNSCFYGKCYYCKDESTGVCGDGTKLEGALILWLPDKMKLTLFKHPWRRTYKNNTLAKWETDNDFCFNTILSNPLSNVGPRLMDIIDTSIVDYLVGNGDRHRYETINNQSIAMMLIMDNGKSFGNPYIDGRSILAPLYQCCQLRESTWLRLLVLQDGVLSAVLSAVLSQDPLAPLLTDLHLKALDRRLKHVLSSVKGCFVKFGVNAVLVKDR